MAFHRSQIRKLVESPLYLLGDGCDVRSHVENVPRNSKGDFVRAVEIPEIFAPIVHRRAEVTENFGHQRARLLSPTIRIRLIYPLVVSSFPPSMKKAFATSSFARASLTFSNHF